MNPLLEAALQYAALGYKVFPCAPGGKTPVTEHGFKDASADAEQIRKWWAKHSEANVGIPTAGLVVIDVDGADNSWPEDPAWRQDLARCPVSLTPHGGRHYIFRQPEGHVWKNTTAKIAPKVDTRAEGGYIVVPPSVVDGNPYRWVDGASLAEMGQLCAPTDWATEFLDGLGGNGSVPEASRGADGAPQGASPDAGGNTIPAGQRNDALARLAGHMRWVGMTREEISAALERVNAGRCQPPLPPREVDRIAASIARYEPDQVAVAVAENHWAQDHGGESAGIDSAQASVDPGPLPDELLRVPGLVSEVMEHCLATAPYPNVIMAFAGALALQATLAGRKVRDPDDNRTNLYLLGLAHSSAGKDRPRKLNTEILHAVGLSSQVGGRFASGEGVQDALFAEPCMLFQTDEIDGMLQSINKARDARHESIMSTLLTVFSSANSVFPMRRKAGREDPGAIDQPCLVVFGTAIPNHYYEALSERMLTNGFFARMIVLECGKRPTGQAPGIHAVPGRILETAKWWAELRPGTGNLQHWHPEPRIVPQTPEAIEILDGARLEGEVEYARAESLNDTVGTAVWGRVAEHARKLALVYAVSENHIQPEIGQAAAKWARRLVVHQARRMLFMAQAHVADNPFHAECLKVLRKLREAPGRELAHSVLLKRMKIDAKTFLSLVTTLEQRGDIVVRTQSTPGRSGRFYGLVEGSGEEGG